MNLFKNHKSDLRRFIILLLLLFWDILRSEVNVVLMRYYLCDVTAICGHTMSNTHLKNTPTHPHTHTHTHTQSHTIYVTMSNKPFVFILMQRKLLSSKVHLLTIFCWLFHQDYTINQFFMYFSSVSLQNISRRDVRGCFLCSDKLICSHFMHKHQDFYLWKMFDSISFVWYILAINTSIRWKSNET